MEDEDATNLAVSKLAPGALGSEPQAEGGEADDATEDIEHDGQVYRIPRALKGAFLMNADYTRKTQELADHRRALDQARQEFAQHAELTQATLQDEAQLAALDHHLAAFDGVAWDAYAAHDPQGAQALWAQYQDLLHARDQYAWRVAHGRDQARQAADRQMAERLTEAGRVLAREIEGWSPEVATKLVEYAKAFGVTLDELREVADPRLWKILHRAHLGDQLAQQRTAAQAAAQVQAVRPAVHVTGAAASTGGVRDELATGEWMQRRNAQTYQPR